MKRQPGRLLINARFMAQEVTGVQRYGHELLARFTAPFETARPTGSASSIKGHAWEQFSLPGKCRGALLWSPGNTGPLSVRNQVVTVHDASTLEHPEWFSRPFALWYQFLLPRLMRTVRRVITVSEFSRQRLLECGDLNPEQVVAIPNGVDPRFRPVDSATLEPFRRQHGLGRPYFLYLGSLEPRKNVATLLQAWTLLGETGYDLILAGAAGHVFRDRGFATLPARTRLWGRVAEADLVPLLAGATGFVFPSIYEGFGLPALEAMACGCPALISATTSLPEVGGPAFEPGTRAGTALYFDPTQPDDMAGALRRLLGLSEADRQTLADNGRARAAEFTWDRAAELTWQVLAQEMARL